MYFKVILCLLLYCTWASAQQKSLYQVLAWKQLEYDFPSDNDRQYAMDNGLFTPGTGTPIDVGMHYYRNGTMRIFVTVPLFTTGIPFSLATVTNKIGSKGPFITAYPDYEWHRTNDNCKGITSAFRVAIDDCDHMWVIDSGVVADRQVCPPQLLTFDLNTDKLINRYQFTTDVYTPVTSLFITPVVDIRDPPPRGRCQKAMVYIADVTGHGLVVYDAERNTAWRVENKLMYPDPDWGTHTIAGESFELMDGLFAINLTPRNIRGERYLYFHALASQTENAVPLRLIDNQAIWQGNKAAMPDAFTMIGQRGVQSEMEAMDSRGNLFSNTHDLKLFAWNINNPYRMSSFKIVANDPQQLQFASGMKVVKNHLGNEVLVMSTCRFQKISAGTLNPNEINFRILACTTLDLLNNKQCNMLGTMNSHNFNSPYNNLILN